MRIETAGSGLLPGRATEHAAGADLFAAADCSLEPGERVAVPTGIRLAIPGGHVGLVWPRSGLALRHGLDTLAGVIDSDYRGEVQVVLVNHGERRVEVRKGDRIAQLLIQKVEPAVFERVDELPDSARGAGGFGSTGT
ncbi:MAG: dUTP diphosphatase [Acidobacteria bacterium]|nr:dUTP diphosphatase [Acidobacteriota bacterium]